jgi:ferritin-like metal-binding protein YciE
MTVTNMYEVFSHELGDVYDAEHRLLEDRGQRAQSASSQKLSDALREDQDRARGRIQNIERVL